MINDFDKYINSDCSKIDYYEEIERNNRILNKRKSFILSLVSDDVKHNIEEDFIDGVHSIIITKVAPDEEYLETGYNEIRYVDQQGYDDNYYGCIWYPLKGKHWIKLTF